MATTLNELRVRDLMVVDPPTLRRRASMREAALRLWRTGAEALLVIADDGAPLGFLSERELVWGAEAQVQGLSAQAGDHACTRFLTAPPDERVVELLARMHDAAVKRAVVLDRAGEIIGTLSLPGGLVLDFLEDEPEEAPTPQAATA
jgi:CBS-domain-containing membrane protein